MWFRLNLYIYYFNIITVIGMNNKDNDNNIKNTL